jgi:hypothetical protein
VYHAFRSGTACVYHAFQDFDEELPDSLSSSVIFFISTISQRSLPSAFIDFFAKTLTACGNRSFAKIPIACVNRPFRKNFHHLRLSIIMPSSPFRNMAWIAAIIFLNYLYYNLKPEEKIDLIKLNIGVVQWLEEDDYSGCEKIDDFRKWFHEDEWTKEMFTFVDKRFQKLLKKVLRKREVYISINDRRTFIFI